MSIQKKSLISTLKTAKKANVATASHEADAKGEKLTSMRVGTLKLSAKNSFKTLKSYKSTKAAQ